MVKSVKKRKRDVKGKAVNIGIDVHKGSWRVTALLEEDEPGVETDR